MEAINDTSAPGSPSHLSSESSEEDMGPNLRATRAKYAFYQSLDDLLRFGQINEVLRNPIDQVPRSPKELSNPRRADFQAWSGGGISLPYNVITSALTEFKTKSRFSRDTTKCTA